MDNNYLISICIPTYNRAKNLKKNLELLNNQIVDSGLLNKVEVIVSNNGSTDDTAQVLSSFDGSMKLTAICQSTNIGAERNILAVLKASTADFVMLLGDDDYLEPSYIKDCVNAIEKYPQLGCLVANYCDYYPENDKLGALREPNCKTQYYIAGFNACVENAWRAHQLSGLTFRKEGVFEEYMKRGLHNLYPQVFFVAYTALRYDVLHFGNLCLRVSSVPQVKKAWSYGEDGLLSDFMDNFVHLQINIFQRIRMERFLIKTEKDRILMYTEPHTRNQVVEGLMQGNYLSPLGKVFWFRYFVNNGYYTGKSYPILRYIIYLHKWFSRLRRSS